MDFNLTPHSPTCIWQLVIPCHSNCDFKATKTLQSQTYTESKDNGFGHLVLFYGYLLVYYQSFKIVNQKFIFIWLILFFIFVTRLIYYYTCFTDWCKNCFSCRISGTSFRVVVENEEQVELSFLRTWASSLEGNYIPLNIDKRSLFLLYICLL